jgi:hypothetical protein
LSLGWAIPNTATRSPGLGEIGRAHTSAATARVAVDAAVTAVQAVLAQAGAQADS